MSTQEDVILEALAHLICTDDNVGRTPLPKAKVETFDGFELLHQSIFDEKKDFILLGDNCSDQPIWPMDVSCGTFHSSNAKFNHGQFDHWQFMRIQTLDRLRWKGRLKTCSPKMVQIEALWAKQDGTHQSDIMPISLFGDRAIYAGQKFFETGCVGSPNPEFFCLNNQQDYTWSIRIAAGLALRRQYLWSVLLGEGCGPRARFVTDPVGVREVFRLRDIPPGARRRAALLHWVREHYRRQRAIPDAERHRIRAHLRGRWSYVWNGLRCQIVPSIDDLEKAA